MLHINIPYDFESNPLLAFSFSFLFFYHLHCRFHFSFSPDVLFFFFPLCPHHCCHNLFFFLFFSPYHPVSRIFCDPRVCSHLSLIHCVFLRFLACYCHHHCSSFLCVSSFFQQIFLHRVLHHQTPVRNLIGSQEKKSFFVSE